MFACSVSRLEIEKAIGQTDVFRVVRLAEDRQRQVLRLRQHLHRGDGDFDIPGRQVRVYRLSCAGDDLALDHDDEFGTDLFGQPEGRCPVGVEDKLGQPVIVAQVDEQQPAMVALAVDPARETDGLADMRFAELATAVAAKTGHGVKP